MKKVIYLTEDELCKAVAHVVTHFGDDCTVKPSATLTMGFMLLGAELTHYIVDNYTVNEHDNDSDKLDFPNSEKNS